MLERLGLMPTQASTVAGDVDALYLFLVGLSLVFSLGIAAALAFFAVRYRRRSDADQSAQIEGSLLLELVWTIIPFGIAMVIFVWGASVFLTLKRPPDDALEVFVVGKQWMWKVQHLEGRREINELHVPVGRAVKLTLTAEDVIHSFYVPAFRVKQDAVPGRYSTTWFEATKTGTFHIFCAEYCGTEHALMIGRVIVLEPDDYQDWLGGDATAGMAVAVSGDGTGSVTEAGGQLFERLGCATCHRQAPGALGPSLTRVFGSTVELHDGRTVVADEAYLRESIVDPRAKLVKGYQPVMPTFQGLVGEEGLMQLVAYIKSLATGQGT
jgi:cytochrome c oxidase subunit 2